MITKYHIKFNNIIINPRVQYNYRNNNCITELLLAYYYVVDGEFLLEYCEYFGQPQV